MTTAIRTAKDANSSARQLMLLAGQGEAVDRLLAKHPKASSKLLEKLSHSSDKATRKNVVLNANASKDVLLKLAPQFPGDFFKNPAFDWLLLEDPDLLFKLGHGVLKNILKRPECPESFMRWVAAHGSEQEKLALAMNLLAPRDALQLLVQQGGPVGDAAAAHETLRSSAPDEDLDRTFEDVVKTSLGALTALDVLPETGDKKAIAAAAKSHDWLERAAVTFCDGVQPSLLRMLLDDEVEVVKQLAIHRLKMLPMQKVSGAL